MLFIQKYPTKNVHREFHRYLKQFPKYTLKCGDRILVEKFIEGIGRTPTQQELKKYIELVIMPTSDRTLRLRQIRSLNKLIKKNGENQQTREFTNPNQLYVG